MITALCGGVGGSKLALGLYRTLPPDSLSVIVNTADDLEFARLHVSPDLDTVMYTLAGLSDPVKGWGIENDTFNALQMLGRYGVETWFQIGDRDLATHLFRAATLLGGLTLTEVSRELAARLEVKAAILPATDEPVQTQLLVDDEWIGFQDYFVRRRHAVPVEAIRYDGIEEALATEDALNAIREAEAIIIVNSNPVLSILPILALVEMQVAIRERSAPCVAVSPIIGSKAVTGPAGELMRLFEQEASATGVAALYEGLIDGIVIDVADRAQEAGIRSIGIAVLCTQTIMQSDGDRERLAAETLEFARGLA